MRREREETEGGDKGCHLGVSPGERWRWLEGPAARLQEPAREEEAPGGRPERSGGGCSGVGSEVPKEGLEGPGGDLNGHGWGGLKGSQLLEPRAEVGRVRQLGGETEQRAACLLVDPWGWMCRTLGSPSRRPT